MNCQPADQVYEFENLEELRLFDPKYQNHSDNAAMQLVAHVFQCKRGSDTQHPLSQIWYDKPVVPV